jgi:hypothetical protein
MCAHCAAGDWGGDVTTGTSWENGVPEEKLIATIVWLGNQREYKQILYSLLLSYQYVR